MKTNFWGSLGKLLYFFGAISLCLEFVVYSEWKAIVDGPYWSLGAAVLWLLFFVAMMCFMLGANVKHFPVPDTQKK